MSNNNSAIVSKVWSFCNTLRDDGVGYGDYLEQLTYLLFLKMADEYTKPPHNRTFSIPKKYNWESLVPLRGAELETHYSKVLRELGKEKGILGQILPRARTKYKTPPSSARLWP
jgi:type I restriction enzyme M protein